MKRWEAIDTTSIPNGGGELKLLSRDGDFVIRITGTTGDLMSSRTHGSEDALGELGCSNCSESDSPKVLVGGLGMGFTLAASLASLPANASVVVAELVPGVARWNKEFIGECAGHPLSDKRVTLTIGDVGELINRAAHGYDSILLDVDNGPEGFTQASNDHLYSLQGLERAYQALRPSGVLAIWSASPVPHFSAMLRKTRFRVTERRVRAHAGKGARHMIWLAQRD